MAWVGRRAVAAMSVRAPAPSGKPGMGGRRDSLARRLPVADEPEGRPAEADVITGADDEARVGAPAVDPGPVPGAEIDEHPGVLYTPQLGVYPRHGRISEREVTVGGPADGEHRSGPARQDERLEAGSRPRGPQSRPDRGTPAIDVCEQ